MALIQQAVITIHGVNHDPTWQPRIARVLEPHFRHKLLCYEGYGGLTGPIKAVVSPWVLPFVAAYFWRAGRMAHQGRWGLALAGLAGAFACLLLGLLVSYMQRRACLQRVKPNIVRAAQGDPVAPHVIAHSFGTYLIGRALLEFPDVLVSRAVLLGSVLPRRYNWEAALNEKEEIIGIRNEVGGRDLTVLAAGLATWAARDIGSAGRKGFIQKDGIVHDAGAVWKTCVSCPTPADAVAVHNVPLPYFAHSTHFLDPVHAKSFWLPSLWGYSPHEFRQYLVLCRVAAWLRQEKLWDDLRDVQAKFNGSVWTWTNGKKLATYVEDQIRHYLDDSKCRALVRRADLNVGHIVEEVIELMYLAAVDASIELDKEGPRDDEVTRAFHPPIAVARAVAVALDLSA